MPGACQRLGPFPIVEYVRAVFRGTVILQRNDAFRWKIPINGFPLTVTPPPSVRNCDGLVNRPPRRFSAFIALRLCSNAKRVNIY